jgi:hypothetical protein
VRSKAAGSALRLGAGIAGICWEEREANACAGAIGLRTGIVYAVYVVSDGQATQDHNVLKWKAASNTQGPPIAAQQCERGGSISI